MKSVEPLTTPDWDRHLVFLVSQPRAGSTLLQRLMARHPDVHTTTEPWWLLQPCYGLKDAGFSAEYEEGGWARLAMRTFFNKIGGRAVQVEGLRAMGKVVYSAALRGSGKTHFLDKTPRYYAIIEELAEIFPHASVVLLLRNPLAVLTSIVRTWVKGHWESLPSYRLDLLEAPARMARGIEALGSRAIVLRYEDVVRAPDAQLTQLWSRLGLPPAPVVLAAGDRPEPAFEFGDPPGGVSSQMPDPRHLERWSDDLRDAQVWRLASDYREHLRAHVPDLLGYDDAAWSAALEAARPARWRRLRTRSLAELLRGGPASV
ncbi:MAG: sulfotransferase [Lentisphaerae bacterium]|nr:sulfotransferase [Lentisphaerota bacterium]